MKYIKYFESGEFESDEYVNRLKTYAIKVSHAVKRIKEISYLISDEDGFDVFIIGENDNRSLLKTGVLHQALQAHIVILNDYENKFWTPGAFDSLPKDEKYIIRQMFYKDLRSKDFYQEFLDRLAEICEEEGVKYDVELATRIIIYI